jgi:hypothetical protein
VTATHRDTVEIRATGLEGSEDHLIIARYARGYTHTGVPPAFDYAFLANDNLTLNGTVGITSLDSTVNANIHTNKSLTSNGNKVLVEGYGTFVPPARAAPRACGSRRAGSVARRATRSRTSHNRIPASPVRAEGPPVPLPVRGR